MDCVRVYLTGINIMAWYYVVSYGLILSNSRLYADGPGCGGDGCVMASIFKSHVSYIPL